MNGDVKKAAVHMSSSGMENFLGLILLRLNLVHCWRYLKPHPGARFFCKDAGCFGTTFSEFLLNVNVP